MGESKNWRLMDDGYSSQGDALLESFMLGRFGSLMPLTFDTGGILGKYLDLTGNIAFALDPPSDLCFDETGDFAISFISSGIQSGSQSLFVLAWGDEVDDVTHGNNAVSIAVSNGNLYFSLMGESGEFRSAYCSDTYDENTFYHYVFRNSPNDSSLMDIFVNGRKLITGIDDKLQSSYSIGNQFFNIGGLQSQGNGSRGVNNSIANIRIADLRIISRAISDAEVNNLYMHYKGLI